MAEQVERLAARDEADDRDIVDFERAWMSHDTADRRLAQLALKESENRFRTLCESSLAGVYVVQDDKIRYASPAFVEILGWNSAELIGLAPLTLIHPDDRALAEESGRRRLSGEAETSRYEARLLRKDGTIAHVEVLGSQTAFDGRPALIGSVLDIGDRRRAEAAMQDRLQFEKLLADLSAGFVNMPSEQTDVLIDTSLKTLVDFLGNDRSTLVEFDEQSRAVVTRSCGTSRGHPAQADRCGIARGDD